MGTNFLKEFIKEELYNASTKTWGFIIAIGGGFVPYVVYFFQLKDIQSPEGKKLIELTFNQALIFFLLSIILIFLLIFIYRLIYYKIKVEFKKKDEEISSLKTEIYYLRDTIKSRSILPAHLSFSDIFSYTIEETNTTKQYLFNKDEIYFDVVCELFFRIKGGIEPMNHIEHFYQNYVAKFHGEKFKNMKVALKSNKYQGFNLGIDTTRSEMNQTIKVNFLNKYLSKDEIVEYTIILRYDAYQFISDEEFKFHKRRLEISQTDYLAHSRVGFLGIKQLSLSIQFPMSYKANFPNFEVRNKSNIPVLNEQKRLLDSGSYSTFEANSKLDLTVNDPIESLNYKIIWKPPTIAQLIESGFINTEQAEIIKSRIKQ